MKKRKAREKRSEEAQRDDGSEESKFVDRKKTKHYIRGERMMPAEREAENSNAGRDDEKKMGDQEEGGCREIRR